MQNRTNQRYTLSASEFLPLVTKVVATQQLFQSQVSDAPFFREICGLVRAHERQRLTHDLHDGISGHLVSIMMLAVGLVFFTAVGVASTAHFLIPEFDWRTGFLLGAVVSTTDAVAATAIAKRIAMLRVNK